MPPSEENPEIENWLLGITANNPNLGDGIDALDLAIKQAVEAEMDQGISELDLALARKNLKKVTKKKVSLVNSTYGAIAASFAGFFAFNIFLTEPFRDGFEPSLADESAVVESLESDGWEMIPEGSSDISDLAESSSAVFIGKNLKPSFFEMLFTEETIIFIQVDGTDTVGILIDKLLSEGGKFSSDWRDNSTPDDIGINWLQIEVSTLDNTDLAPIRQWLTSQKLWKPDESVHNWLKLNTGQFNTGDESSTRLILQFIISDNKNPQ